jgi:hypothetical protein
MKLKTLSITEITQKPNKLRTALDDGDVRIEWKEQKPNGKVLFSAIVKKEVK